MYLIVYLSEPIYKYYHQLVYGQRKFTELSKVPVLSITGCRRDSSGSAI